jgi:hypothetical protein
MTPCSFGCSSREPFPTGTVMTPNGTQPCCSSSRSQEENEPSGTDDYLEAISFGLTVLGWTTRTGTELPPETVQALLQAPREVLLNLGIFDDHDGQLKANTVTPQGLTFARAALHS